MATGRRAVSLLHEVRRGLRPLDDNTAFVMDPALAAGEPLAPPGGETKGWKGTTSGVKE